MDAATRDPGQWLLAAVQRLGELTAGRERTGSDHESADDVHGTVDTDDAIGFDPMPLLRALDQAGAKVVAIGQIAAILHGSNELTGDLDLLWSGDDDEAAAIEQAFREVGAVVADDDNRPIPLDADAFRLPKVLFRTEHACGDCCTPKLPWGDHDVRAFIGRADRCDIDGVTVHYLALDDLQAMRRAVGRPKDLRRVAELDRIHGR